MKAAEVVKTIRNGALKIEIRRFADGRLGFDWQADKYDRKKVRLHSLADAEKRAKDLISAARAGKIDRMDIDDELFAEFLRWKAERKDSLPVPQVVERFLHAKRTKGRSAKTLRGLDYTLKTFATSFPCEINKLNRLGVEAWLDRQNVGARRWNNMLADIIALVRFARRDGLLTHEPTGVEQIEKKKVVVTVKTYTPEELSVLLNGCSKDWLPVLVLGAFSGIRPEELAPEDRNEKPGLAWENLLWDKRKVDVPAAVSKTRRRRFAPLPDAALAFLAPYRKKKGPIAPEGVRLSNYVRRLKVVTGAAWKPDALRHSFASYRLALTKDMAALALEMGNSPDMIFKHYLELAHEDVAARYFGLRPGKLALDGTFTPQSDRKAA